MGLFLVTACIGEVAYRLNLKGRFTCIHHVFHVSLLRRFVASSDGIEPPEPIEVEKHLGVCCGAPLSVSMWMLGQLAVS